MGTDKALLQLAGKPLIVHVLDIARAVTPNVSIVGDREKLAAFGDVVTDIFPDHGPLGGIHAALTHSQADWNLLLAVDLPFITAKLLAYLLAQAQCSQATVTLASTDGYLHPLCAVYRRSFAELAARALADKKNKIDRLFRGDVPVRIIAEQELLHAGFSPALFRNVNTPEEWEKAKAALNAEPQ